MSKRRYQPNSDNSKTYFPDGTAKLPTNRPIAVYYRQSTLAQVGNISTSMQTVDMVEILIQKGWAEDDIILIDMDEGISGSTKIDERPGMRRLFDLIT
jgi:DNA invertase Pin-like site-specific DNA recombinase